MKFHFLGSVLTAISITLTAVSGTVEKRIIFAGISILLFMGTLVVFGYDYDMVQMHAWKSKEERLRKELKKD